MRELPVEWIWPEELKRFNRPEEESKKTIYVVPYDRKATEGLDRFQHEQVAHLTVLVNCIRWMEWERRILTRKFIKERYAGNKPLRLRVVGDVSCDDGGSVDFCTYTYPDNPVYIYQPDYDTDELDWSAPGVRNDILKDEVEAACRPGFEGTGIAVMAVTNLPTELPKDASEFFSDKLMNLKNFKAGTNDDPLFLPYQMALLDEDKPATFKELENSWVPEKISHALERAIIMYNGELIKPYDYLQDHLTRYQAK